MRSLFQILYGIICNIYSRLITLLEKLFLKKSSKRSNLLDKKGFIKINKKSNLNKSKRIIDLVFSSSSKFFFANEYHKRLILSKNNLEELVNLIFDKEFCHFLFSLTGYKYSIDFVGAYENFYIPQKDQKKSWYANHYHLDKPNSQNMLKVFIPMADIGIDDGPLEVLSINQTKKYFSSQKLNKNLEKFYMLGVLGDIFLCKLNLCMHKAGIPDRGKTTKLIMIQLNPSGNWFINSRLYKRQYLREPKFTSLGNQFVGRKKLII